MWTPKSPIQNRRAWMSLIHYMNNSPSKFKVKAKGLHILLLTSPQRMPVQPNLNYNPNALSSLIYFWMLICILHLYMGYGSFSYNFLLLHYRRQALERVGILGAFITGIVWHI